jgi:hypothetical protein
MTKFVFLNELRFKCESPGGLTGAFLCSVFIIAEWVKLLCQVDVVDFVVVMEVWGLDSFLRIDAEGWDGFFRLGWGEQTTARVTAKCRGRIVRKTRWLSDGFTVVSGGLLVA